MYPRFLLSFAHISFERVRKKEWERERRRYLLPLLPSYFLFVAFSCQSTWREENHEIKFIDRRYTECISNIKHVILASGCSFTNNQLHFNIWKVEVWGIILNTPCNCPLYWNWSLMDQLCLIWLNHQSCELWETFSCVLSWQQRPSCPSALLAMVKKMFLKHTVPETGPKLCSLKCGRVFNFAYVSQLGSCCSLTFWWKKK